MHLFAVTEGIILVLSSLLILIGHAQCTTWPIQQEKKKIKDRNSVDFNNVSDTSYSDFRNSEDLCSHFASINEVLYRFKVVEEKRGLTEFPEKKISGWDCEP